MRQCKSCGGFCKKSRCERANVSKDESKPLTDEQINLLDLPEREKATVRDLVRIIEKAHGFGCEK